MSSPQPRERTRTRRKRRLGSLPAEDALHFQHARLLLELSRATGADWGASIRHICQFEAQVLNVERVSYWSFYPEIGALICDAGYVASGRTYEQGATLLESELTEYFAAIREARVVKLEELVDDPRARNLSEYCSSRGITSMLEIPVWMEGRLCGVLSHEQVGSPRRWTVAEEEFASGVGQVVAAALAARTQTPAEAAARRAAFLDVVSRTFLSSLDIRQIAQSAVALAVPKLAEISNVWMLEHDSKLELLASCHVASRQAPQVVDAARATTKHQAPVLAAQVLRQEQSLLIPDTGRARNELYAEIGPEKRAVFEEAGISGAMAVPLAVAGKTFGAMTFFGVGGRHFDSDDLFLSQEVGSRLAAALENARIHAVARDAIRARDEFLVLLAHELRTPLTSIRLMADIMYRSAEDSTNLSERTRSASIVRQVRRFCGVVEGVIEAMQVRGEGIKLELETCDLAVIVKHVVNEVAYRARQTGASVAVSTTPIVARFDRVRIDRALYALLDNALKFGAGKPIEVVLQRIESDAVISVRDHGQGIPPDKLPSIFSPFERTMPKSYGGLGLGLYVAKAVVEAHGGEIQIESRPGQGTTACVRLPLAR
jgi:signal transduction histidine kinase